MIPLIVCVVCFLLVPFLFELVGLYFGWVSQKFENYRTRKYIERITGERR